MTAAICHVYGQFDQTRGRLADELDLLDRLGIPADLTVRCRPDPAHAPRLRAWAGRGLVAPSLYPPDLDPACADPNWWAYDEAACDRLLGLAQELWRGQGFGALEALTTYTPGNGLVAACRRRGVRYLLGFCAPTVINDGHWQITHAGAPLAPYLASADDYRRPGTNPEPVLISSMELRNPLTCAEHWSEGPFCPLNLVMGDRTIEPGEQPLETFAACEDWLRLSEADGVPRFFHINLQWFTSPRCFDLNRRCLEWLHRQARMGRIRFTTLRERRAELATAGGVAAQTVWWRGSCHGQTIGGQPAGGVECIVHESPQGQWQFRRGEAGPRRHYDYTRAWNCPPFDPLGLQPAFASPEARITQERQALDDERVELTLRWESAAPGRLCAWDACAGLRAPLRVLDAGGLAVEPVPHPGGIGGALLLTVPIGHGEARVIIAHAGAAEERATRRWAGLVTVESSELDQRPYTRLALDVPARVRFPLATTARHAVRWETVTGGEVRRGLLLPGDRVEIELDGRRGASLARLWDVDAAGLVEPVAELAAERARLVAEAQAAVREFAPGLAPPGEPLRCASEDLTPAWAVAVAKAATDREIALVDPLAERLAGGRLLAAIHCAADLPYGTKGRVRSQRYDRQDGDGFFAIYYDYGQSHGPGLCGWNQFWQVDLGLRGLAPGLRHRLVLNAYDPEARGGAVRVLARRCDAHGRAPDGAPVFELRGQQRLAQGVAARHAAEAFIVLDLPAELCAGGTIDVMIRSHSEAVRYDRLAEGYGYVFLAHAWVATA